MSKKNAEIGTVIKLEKKHYGALNSIINECDNSDVAFRAASEYMKKASRKLWDFINEIAPATMDREATYNRKNKVVTITGNGFDRLKEKNK